MIETRCASLILLLEGSMNRWKKNGAERYKIKSFRSVCEVKLFVMLRYFHPVCAISIIDWTASRTRTLPSMLPSINNQKSHFFTSKGIKRHVKYCTISKLTNHSKTEIKIHLIIDDKINDSQSKMLNREKTPKKILTYLGNELAQYLDQYPDKVQFSNATDVFLCVFLLFHHIIWELLILLSWMIIHEGMLWG